jgi:hypothetical protein
MKRERNQNENHGIQCLAVWNLSLRNKLLELVLSHKLLFGAYRYGVGIGEMSISRWLGHKYFLR